MTKKTRSDTKAQKRRRIELIRQMDESLAVPQTFVDQLSGEYLALNEDYDGRGVPTPYELQKIYLIDYDNLDFSERRRKLDRTLNDTGIEENIGSLDLDQLADAHKYLPREARE